MTDPYHNPSDLATYLMVIIPILVMYALVSGRWRCRWLTGLLTILLICLVRTESRGAWLGLAASIVVIAWQPGRYRRYAAILGGGLVVTAVALLYWAGHLSALHSSSQIGNVDRWDMWMTAWGMI